LAEPRLKIAVFIDFDNIEIGVKTTLGGHFEVGPVLEAIKERGEVVTKIAYGDWTRAGDYSRSLTQHAIHMVQRNLTPGGDKNGADINLALDALEMAFTHNHINAFVIVGGDSDFMALVEKLKQYDRKIMVVGGRQFTSTILQRNCHEFIAYENLVGRRASGRKGATAGRDPAEAMPLVKRALKVLADREVMPQLGVLKSTLLQLDSTFSEREYGVSSFREFVDRLARAGYLTLRGSDRSIHVELRDGEPAEADATPAPVPAPAPEATDGAAREPETAAPVSPAAQADAYAVIRNAFLRPGAVTRWPLYVRQVKQLLKAANEGFDERRYGFSGIIDALRYAQREGLFRLDRDRQGVIRVYPGTLFERPVTDEAAGTESAAASEPQVIEEEMPAAPRETEPVVPVVEAEVAEPGGTTADAVDAAVASPDTSAARPTRRGTARRARKSSAAGATKRARTSASATARKPRRRAADGKAPES
jgi:uncharacterized LabA/DUF88 family protein